MIRLNKKGGCSCFIITTNSMLTVVQTLGNRRVSHFDFTTILDFFSVTMAIQHRSVHLSTVEIKPECQATTKCYFYGPVLFLLL